MYTRSSWRTKVLAAAPLALLILSLANAQQSATDEGRRKIKSKTTPNYPDLARRMSISGKVKIEVVIAPDGRVKSARAIGGHPVLVQACLDSVKDWRFDPAPEETTQIVEFSFKE